MARTEADRFSQGEIRRLGPTAANDVGILGIEVCDWYLGIRPMQAAASCEGAGPDQGVDALMYKSPDPTAHISRCGNPHCDRLCLFCSTVDQQRPDIAPVQERMPGNMRSKGGRVDWRLRAVPPPRVDRLRSFAARTGAPWVIAIILRRVFAKHCRQRKDRMRSIDELVLL